MSKNSKGFAHLFLLLGVFLFVGLGGFWLWKNNNLIFTDKKPISTSNTTLSKEKIPEDWKTFSYSNDQNLINFQLKYPADWIVMSPANNPDDPCTLETLNNHAVVFSEKYLEKCGFQIHMLPSDEAEFAIQIGSPIKDIYTILEPPVEKIMVAGEEAAMYRYSFQQALPNINATRIYFNHGDNGFTIFLKNTKDDSSEYDPIYDQVLSTFEFIN